MTPVPQIAFARGLCALVIAAWAMAFAAQPALGRSEDACVRWPQIYLMMGNDLQARHFVLEPTGRSAQAMPVFGVSEGRSILHKPFRLSLDVSDKVSIFQSNTPKMCVLARDRFATAMEIPVFFVGRPGASLDDLEKDTELLVFDPSAPLDAGSDFADITFRLRRGGSRFNEIRPFFRCGLAGLLVCQQSCPADWPTLAASLVNELVRGEVVTASEPYENAPRQRTQGRPQPPEPQITRAPPNRPVEELEPAPMPPPRTRSAENCPPGEEREVKPLPRRSEAPPPPVPEVEPLSPVTRPAPPAREAPPALPRSLPRKVETSPPVEPYSPRTSPVPVPPSPKTEIVPVPVPVPVPPPPKREVVPVPEPVPAPPPPKREVVPVPEPVPVPPPPKREVVPVPEPVPAPLPPKKEVVPVPVPVPALPPPKKEVVPVPVPVPALPPPKKEVVPVPVPVPAPPLPKTEVVPVPVPVPAPPPPKTEVVPVPVPVPALPPPKKEVVPVPVPVPALPPPKTEVVPELPPAPPPPPPQHVTIAFELKGTQPVPAAEVVQAEGNLAIDGVPLQVTTDGFTADLPPESARKLGDGAYLKKLLRRYQLLVVKKDTDRVVLVVDPLYVHAEGLKLEIHDAAGDPVSGCQLGLDVSADRRLGEGWNKLGEQERLHGLEFTEDGSHFVLTPPSGIEPDELLISTAVPGNAARITNNGPGCQIENRPWVTAEELRSGQIVRSLLRTGQILIAVLSTDSSFASSVTAAGADGFWSEAMRLVNVVSTAAWEKKVLARAQAPGASPETGDLQVEGQGRALAADGTRGAILKILSRDSAEPAGLLSIPQIQPISRNTLDLALGLIRKDASISAQYSVKQEALLLITGSVEERMSQFCQLSAHRDRSPWFSPQWAKQARRVFAMKVWSPVAVAAMQSASLIKPAQNAPDGVYICNISGPDGDKIALYGISPKVVSDANARTKVFSYLTGQANSFLRP